MLIVFFISWFQQPQGVWLSVEIILWHCFYFAASLHPSGRWVSSQLLARQGALRGDRATGEKGLTQRDRLTHNCVQNKLSLVQVLACRLFSTKPLSEPMLASRHLEPSKQTSMKFERKYQAFLPSFKIMHLDMLHTKWLQFCSGLSGLT